MQCSVLRLPWKSNLYHYAAYVVWQVIWSSDFKVSYVLLTGLMYGMHVSSSAVRFRLAKKERILCYHGSFLKIVALDELTLFQSIWCAPAEKYIPILSVSFQLLKNTVIIFQIVLRNDECNNWAAWWFLNAQLSVWWNVWAPVNWTCARRCLRNANNNRTWQLVRQVSVGLRIQSY